MLPLNALQPVTDKVCAAGLSAAIEWLPKISGGALNFHVSAAAGGVEDGSLTRGDGLALTGLEDIMVTTDAKPEETVYLPRFIGVDYDGTSWQAGNAAAFDSAAANWKTDGDGRLAIANLPFFARGIQRRTAAANDRTASACKRCLHVCAGTTHILTTTTRRTATEP